MSHLLAPAKPASEAHTQPQTPHTAPAEVSPLASPHAASEAAESLQNEAPRIITEADGTGPGCVGLVRRIINGKVQYSLATWYCPRCHCHRRRAPPSVYPQAPKRLVQVCVHCHRALRTGSLWDRDAERARAGKDVKRPIAPYFARAKHNQ